MASDAYAAFNPGTGLLTIRGTPRDEHVWIETNNHETVVKINGAVEARFDPTQLRRIDANLGRGADSFRIPSNSGANRLNPAQVDIALGSGVDQRVDLDFGSVGTINIKAASGTNTSVTVNSTVIDRLFIDFGSDSNWSQDLVALHNSEVRNMNLNMGGGNDTVRLGSNQVTEGDIKMGAGDDAMIDLGRNNFQGGTFDGGSGNDFLPESLRRRIRVASFERR